MDETVSVRLIEALTRIWSAIRVRHPDVPPVMVLAAPAPRGQGNVLGHFAPLRWKPREQHRQLVHEVVVVGEHLDRAAIDVLETLLHEASHALNHHRDPTRPDCSASQYHNKRFKEAAEELGLAVAQVRHYGYAYTTLPPETATRYAAETRELGDVLIHRMGMRIAPPVGPTGTAGDDDADKPDATSTRSRKATCHCGFIIRVSKKTIEDTVIRCDTCGAPFRLT